MKINKAGAQILPVTGEALNVQYIDMKTKKLNYNWEILCRESRVSLTWLTKLWILRMLKLYISCQALVGRAAIHTSQRHYIFLIRVSILLQWCLKLHTSHRELTSYARQTWHREFRKLTSKNIACNTSLRIWCSSKYLSISGHVHDRIGKNNSSIFSSAEGLTW